METTNPTQAAKAKETVKKARSTRKGHTAKNIMTAVSTHNVDQSIRVTDKDLLLALFPELEDVFKLFPNLYRLEINHGIASKKYSIWYKPHGQVTEGYDLRTLKQYQIDKSKGTGRIY